MPHAHPVAPASDVEPPLCITHLLARQAETLPNAPAILAPGRVPLTYGRLYRHVGEVIQLLHAMGLGQHDRIALVLPDGPELAVASIAIAAGATCAPLNPAYSVKEYNFFLTELHLKALIIQADMDSPARLVAQQNGLCIIELLPAFEAEAGLFTLTAAGYPYAVPPTFSQSNDVAFVLHTSGTTSQPKTVPLTHTNICTSAHNTRVALALAASDCCLDVMPLCYGNGLGAMFTSLAAGASVVCPPSFSASQFFAWIAECRPTWYTAVPTVHEAILARAASHYETILHYPLRFIRSGSAPLPPQIYTELERVFQAPVIEYYGMAEASSQITCNPLPPRARKIGSVGLAAGPEVMIMDEVGSVLPLGTIGEIVLRGASIFGGYDNNPEANKSAVTDGWFRTGDQGFLDAEGYLFITGRLKEIINRGGTKIMPREVDEVLLNHPAVAQAVTFAVPDTRLGEEIAAAVVLRQHAAATASAIREFAAKHLAEFKVPRLVHIVENLPQGPTGKLQRLVLAEQLGLTAPPQAHSARPAAYTAPRTVVEEMLAWLWAQVLELERVGIHDDFFHLGGDSLLATQLLSRVHEVTHVELSLFDFFETPTVAGLARRIEIAHQRASVSQTPLLQPVSRERQLPLSYAQQRLWFLAQLGLSNEAYTVLDVIRLCGPLHVAALAQSLQEIIRRHDSLRTTFHDIAGQPFQVIGLDTHFLLSVVELQVLPEYEREAQVRALARVEVHQPFDLAQGPLVRAQLLCLADEEYMLLLTRHNIVFDGWSRGVLWRELAVLYEAFTAGKPSPLSELAIQYADFASWQHQWLQGQELGRQLAYWQRQLDGMSPLQLPTDRPRPTVQTFRGARHLLALSPTLLSALQALSRRYGVTLFMTLLATFQTLLHRYSGQDDIAVGSLVANRNQIEVEGLIGFFTNTLVLRTDLSGDPSFQELLSRVRTVALGAYSHQDLPFEKLLEALQPERNLSCTPLFQVLFVLQNTPRHTPKLKGLTLSILEVDPGTAKFDLTLELWETPESLRGHFEYNIDLFDAATIARMAGHLQTLLEGIVTDPEQRLSALPLLTADERHRSLVEWNNTRTDYPYDQCLHQLFEIQVAKTPDAIAVVCADEHLTYRELNHRANHVAHYLQARGVGPEVLVGLCMERCLDMVVGLLGILKAGGVYVPLDPTYPPERLAFMLTDTRIPVLLTQGHHVAGLPPHEAQVVSLDTQWQVIAQYSDQNPVSGATADNAAYVLYTSGSTGRPKGILGSHRAMLNTLSWMWQTYPCTSQEVYCQKASMSYMDSIQELLEPLLQGVRTVLIPDKALRDLTEFVRTLAIHCVTRILLVPSLLRVLLDTYVDLQSRLPSLKLWFTGGEFLSKDLWQRFLEVMPHSRLVNGYGTSEVSNYATWYDTGPRRQELAHVPIGCPIANTQLYLLDYRLQPVPTGVPGELYIGGAGLARGYLNCPELTAEKFIPHPFSNEPGVRLYKTGDLVRYLWDGSIEFLSRLDEQVKLRGFRIELGEVEAALEQHSAVRETVVRVHEDVSGEKRLVAYIVPVDIQGPSDRELRRFLKKQLPDYMVPSTFVKLHTLPLTPSGKVDRQALPRPDRLRPDLEEPFVAPCTVTEQRIADIWSHLLGLQWIGIHDNFFELGGHSLLAMQCMARLQAAFQMDLSVRCLFDTPTIADLAAYLETVRGARNGLQVLSEALTDDREEGEV
jgi:amino acid adenylation domain-containing protein